MKKLFCLAWSIGMIYLISYILFGDVLPISFIKSWLVAPTVAIGVVIAMIIAIIPWAFADLEK